MDGHNGCECNEVWDRNGVEARNVSGEIQDVDSGVMSTHEEVTVGTRGRENEVGAFKGKDSGSVTSSMHDKMHKDLSDVVG